MVSHCIVDGCKSHKTKEGGKKIRAFHTYPVGPLREQWNRALNMLVAVPGTVCSDHFLDSDYSFKSEHKWALKGTAVPTQNIPQPPCKEEVVQKEHGAQADYILLDNMTPPPAKKSRQDESCDITTKSECLGEVKKFLEDEIHENEPLHNNIETKLSPVQKYVQNSGDRECNLENNQISSPAPMNMREKMLNEDHASLECNFTFKTIQNLSVHQKNINPEKEVISGTRPGSGDQYHQGHMGNLNLADFEKHSLKQVVSGEEEETIKEENEELRVKEEQMKKQLSKKNTLEFFDFPKFVSDTQPISKTNVINDEVNDDYEDIKRLEDLRILIKDLREMEEALQSKNCDVKLRVSQMEERIMKFKCKVAEKVVKNETAVKLGFEFGKRKEKESSPVKSLQCEGNKSTKKLPSNQDIINNYTCPAPARNLTFYDNEKLKKHLKNVHSGPETGKLKQGEKNVSGGLHTKVINDEWDPGHISKENNSSPSKSLQGEANNSTEKLQSDQETIHNHTCPAPVCNRSFSNAERLQTHLKNVHSMDRGGRPRQEETRVSEGLVHAKVINDEWDPGHVCRECGYVAKKESHLRLHIKGVHEKIKDHVCTECGYAAARIDTLKNHMASVHKKGERQYKCEKCPYTSGNRNIYFDHIKAVHEKIKDYVCQECGYAASRKFTLKSHRLAVHNLGGEQYKCKHCTFTAYSNMKVWYHVQKVHPDFGSSTKNSSGATISE